MPVFFFCNLETLKKQASQQNAEYGRLADEHNKAVSYIFKFFYGIWPDSFQAGAVSDKKAD